MDEPEFTRQSVTVPNGHANELSSMHDAIMNDTAPLGGMSALASILRELSDTAHECETMIDHYDEKDPIPADVKSAVRRALQEMNTTLSAMALKAMQSDKP
jgi:hypothetical protein